MSPIEHTRVTIAHLHAGIPQSAIAILSLLAENELRPREIAARTKLSQANINSLGGMLISKSYMTKRRDGDDERAVYYQITQQGREFINQIIAPASATP